MLCGLFNISASFYGYINKILTEKLNILVIVYLNNIFIYTKDPNQVHINFVWWVFEELKNHGLFANLKNYQFYKNKVCFLEYVVLAQGVQIGDKKIEVVKNWLEPKSVHDI